MAADSEELARGGQFGGSHLYDRLPQELLGMCRGLLMDGAVVDREIHELDRWCDTNPAASRIWPGNVLVARLRRVLSDGRIDEDERADLHLLLEEITGYRGGHQRAASSIFTDPEPELVIVEEVFALTGTFLYGPRKKVVEVIELIGGKVSDSITRRTHYLIVGGRATPAWLEADMGTKIMDALEINQLAAKGQRAPIPIVREECWARYILKSD